MEGDIVLGIKNKLFWTRNITEKREIIRAGMCISLPLLDFYVLFYMGSMRNM